MDPVAHTQYYSRSSGGPIYPIGRLAFTSERDCSADIFRAHPGGSGLERLTVDPAFDDLIEFTSFRDGDFEIHSVRRRTASGGKDEPLVSDYGPPPYGELFAMRADGSGVRQLTDNQWEDALPAFQPKSNEMGGGHL